MILRLLRLAAIRAAAAAKSTKSAQSKPQNRHFPNEETTTRNRTSRQGISRDVPAAAAASGGAPDPLLFLLASLGPRGGLALLLSSRLSPRSLCPEDDEARSSCRLEPDSYRSEPRSRLELDLSPSSLEGRDLDGEESCVSHLRLRRSSEYRDICFVCCGTASTFKVENGEMLGGAQILRERAKAGNLCRGRFYSPTRS